MTLFILFPHIYIRKNYNTMLLYDTIKGSHRLINLDEIDFKIVSDYIFEYSNSSLVQELSCLGFGYILTTQVMPTCINSINFTTSRDKIQNALSYNDGRSLLDSISKISVFIDNDGVCFDNDNAFSVLSFPKQSVENLTDVFNFFESNRFNNLEHLEIVSSLSNRAIQFAEKFQNTGLVISFKIVLKSDDDIANIISYASDNKDILLKVFLPLEISALQDKLDLNNLSVVPYSSNLKDILNSNINNIFPLIYNSQKHCDLIEAVKISKDDILSRNLSITDLRQNRILNKLLWGHITINNGMVFSGTQKIGALSNFRDNFNKWYYSEDNNWFMNRAKLQKCKDCIFVDLCPSFSILEELDIIDYPCIR